MAMSSTRALSSASLKSRSIQTRERNCATWPMRNRPSHRWFHALVVTGAAITSCGGSTDDSETDAAADSPADGIPQFDGTSDADAGGSIIITTDGAIITDDAADVRTDPRCCTITTLQLEC